MAENIFELSDQNRTEIASRIAAANEDNPGVDGMELNYDAGLDYLRISIGRRRTSLALDLEDRAGAILLYDPDTYAISGLEVPSFMAKVTKGRLREDFWKFIASAIREHGSTIYFAGRADSERAGRAIRELVPT
jgi:hypothetical protein